jgi:dolichol kinase
MPKKYKFELKRKLIHIIAIVLILLFFYLSLTYNKFVSLLPIIIFLFLALILECLRIKRVKLPIYPSFFRRNEKNKLGGHIYYLIGILIVLMFFDFDIALASILMLIFGDTTAALFGSKFGKIYIIKDKALEGIIAEFIVDLIIGLIILPYFIAIPMALIATLSESFIGKIDDNLTVPVFSSLVGQIMRFLV